MNEPEFTRFITRKINPDVAPDLARVVVRGLTPPGLPASQAARFVDLWHWRIDPVPGRYSQLAPDMILGDKRDRLAAVYEFKSPTARTQWPGRGGLRDAKAWPGEGPLKIRGSYLANTDPGLDFPHRDQDCIGRDQGCDYWKLARVRDGDLHYPVVHQADVYASTVSYVPHGLQVPDQSEVNFVFVAPHERAIADFFTDLVSADLWQVVRLPDALDYWRTQTHVRGVSAVVAATSDFLGLRPEAARLKSVARPIRFQGGR